MQLCKLSCLQRTDHKFRILEPQKVPPRAWKWCSFEEKCWWLQQEYASTTSQLADYILITKWLPKISYKRCHALVSETDGYPAFPLSGPHCTNIAVQRKELMTWWPYAPLRSIHMKNRWLSCLDSQYSVDWDVLAACSTSIPNQRNLNRCWYV